MLSRIDSGFPTAPLACYSFSARNSTAVSRKRHTDVNPASLQVKTRRVRRNTFNLRRCSCYFLNIRRPQFPLAIKSVLLLIVRYSWYGSCILSRTISTSYTRCVFFMGLLYRILYTHLLCIFEYLYPIIHLLFYIFPLLLIYYSTFIAGTINWKCKVIYMKLIFYLIKRHF